MPTTRSSVASLRPGRDLCRHDVTDRGAEGVERVPDRRRSRLRPAGRALEDRRRQLTLDARGGEAGHGATVEQERHQCEAGRGDDVVGLAERRRQRIGRLVAVGVEGEQVGVEPVARRCVDQAHRRRHEGGAQGEEHGGRSGRGERSPAARRSVCSARVIPAIAAGPRAALASHDERRGDGRARISPHRRRRAVRATSVSTIAAAPTRRPSCRSTVRATDRGRAAGRPARAARPAASRRGRRRRRRRRRSPTWPARRARSCERSIPSARRVALSARPRARLRWITWPAPMTVAAKARSPERDEHDHQRTHRLVDRVDLLTARRLQLVTERTDRGGEVAARVEPRRQVDVAHRVHDEVAMGVEERACEHGDAHDRRLVADRLDRHRADAGDRHRRRPLSDRSRA